MGDRRVSTPIILVVDDDLLHRDLLFRLLSIWQPECDVRIASDGHTALTVLAEAPIALVVTDYNMPEMNGVTLTQTIRALWPATKVLMVTILESTSLAARARQVGADAVMGKPINLTAMEATVRSLLT